MHFQANVIILRENSIFVPVPTELVIAAVFRIQMWFRDMVRQRVLRERLQMFLRKKQELLTRIIRIQRAIRRFLGAKRFSICEPLTTSPMFLFSFTETHYSNRAGVIQAWWKCRRSTKLRGRSDGSATEPRSPSVVSKKSEFIMDPRLLVSRDC
jgi:hypothetical protein